ncbi:MAG TPA: hypothetical protein VFG21_08835 [Xanthomonadaceae bacterium]|nr:hypothetical protein [Xanthomonadaceae bacterium]
MRRPGRVLAAIAGVLFGGSVLAQTIVLEDGVGARFTIPSEAGTGDFVVDVPEGTGALQVTLEGPDNAADVDIYLRHGSPLRGFGVSDLLSVLEESQYFSQSFGNQESIVVTRFGSVPLRSGRWHVGVQNLGSVSAEVTLTARLLSAAPVADLEVLYDYSGQVEFDGESITCNTAPWRDATLGAQRTAAMNRAMELIRDALKPVVPIRVLACWLTQEEDVLASARSSDLMFHDLGVDPARFGGTGRLATSPLPMLPERYTFFASAVASNRGGASRCGIVGGECEDAHDVVAFIGANLDENPVNGGRWYYGLDGNPPQGDFDFISVMMHEVIHGLGFFGLIRISEDPQVLGQRVFVYDDAYGKHVRWVPGDGSDRPILSLSDADRGMALTSGFQLRFAGERVRNSSLNPNRGFGAPQDYINLYAPATPNPGSTLSHFASVRELMYFAVSTGNANRQLGLAKPLLEDVGWLRVEQAPREFPMPTGGQYYDLARSGHGIAMYPIAGLENLWFLVFYTYDDAGKPEFYVAVGPVIDGVFLPVRDPVSGDSLLRTLPDGTVDFAAGFDGQVRVDFNEAANSPVCNDGFPNRALADPQLAVMTWTIDDGQTQSPQGQWCMQPLTGGAVDDDRTNLFNSLTDPGWGLSTLSFASSEGEGFAFQIYYPDGNGKPRWGLVTTGDYQAGVPLTVLQAQGYCRTCPKPDSLQFVPIGTLSVDIRDPRVDQAAGSSMSADIGFDGATTGRFQKTDSAIVARATPRP